MTITDALMLLAAGMAASSTSTVLSLASLVSCPVLLALGLPPLVANVTNTVSLVLTGAGSAAGSRAPVLHRSGESPIMINTLPVTPFSTASCAAAISSSRKRWTGNGVRAPARRASVMSATA